MTIVPGDWDRFWADTSAETALWRAFAASLADRCVIPERALLNGLRVLIRMLE
jgi:hypothetical protein